MLDLKRLHILREVANRGSFSAAADALFLSQSAVSQQIATLEREAGTSLLHRTRGAPKLTDAGRVLVSHADAAIARLEEAERDLAALAGLEGGQLRLASFPSAGATLLTEAVSVFHDRYPKVKLSVAELEPEESLPQLRGGELDLALVFDYPLVPAEADRDLDRTLLLTESMHLVLPGDHPLAKRRRVHLADLADHDWLCGLTLGSCREVVLQACRNAGFEPKIGFESDDYSVMQGFVAAGLGVTLLPDLALPTLRSDVVIRPTEPEAPERRVWAVTRAAGSRSPATEAMVEVMVSVSERFKDPRGDALERAA